MTEEKTSAGNGSPHRFLRIWFCASLLIAIGMLLGVCWLAESYEKTFRQLELGSLPAPTEALLALSQILRTRLGAAVALGIGLTLCAMARRGLFDRALLKLVILNCIFIVLVIPLSIFSLHHPVAMIQRGLQAK